MKKEGRPTINGIGEIGRQSGPGRNTGRETKTTFRNAGEICLAMLAEIRARKK